MSTRASAGRVGRVVQHHGESSNQVAAFNLRAAERPTSSRGQLHMRGLAGAHQPTKHAESMSAIQAREVDGLSGLQCRRS